MLSRRTGADHRLHRHARTQRPAVTASVEYLTAHRDALHEAIAAITRRQTTQQVVDRLRAAGVPVSAVNDLSRLLHDPQVQALGLHAGLPIQEGRELVAVGTPIRIDGERSYQPHLSRRVGEDTRGVLEAAGLQPQEIEQLAASKAVQL